MALSSVPYPQSLDSLLISGAGATIWISAHEGDEISYLVAMVAGINKQR